MISQTVHRLQSYWNLALAFRRPEVSKENLTMAYTRLFLGPGQPLVYPYESAYIEGQLMGEVTAQVVACYAEAGLQLSMAERELPDHVSVELAFMTYLIGQEAWHPARRRMWRQYQKRFLQEHMACWLPQFCKKVEEIANHPFYAEAASATKDLIEKDINLLLPPQTRLVPTQQSKRRNPNIHLSMDLFRCTLCTLCVDTCQSGALGVSCTPTLMRLSFNPAHCNGCRKCMRMCPEKAISIEPRSPLATPPAQSKSVVATALRVICPRCRRPHIAEPLLERLYERLGGGETVRHSLIFCPICKASVGEGLTA